ncbi:NAD(P)-binding protein [Aureobasidium pullulans]|nr:NAD(P)-binding protein [Aureobasidium pullulans]TIA29934.1 NAD(P)-binding protein [Aureobasidium pullulans]
MASTSSIDAMATLKAYESTAASAEEIRVYLSRNPEYRRLDELQQKGWSNPAGDQFFAARRQKSDNTSKADQRGLLGMMINVGRDLQGTIGAFDLPSNSDRLAILDLCMAPGGLVTSALEVNKSAKVGTFSLPSVKGGHNVMINFGPRDERVKVRFMDITMFAEEFGSPTDRKHHLDWTSLRQKWPYHTSHYDLVICDGVPMRGQNLDDNAISVQPMRLTCAELYLGLKRIRRGGTLIVLLHRINNVRTFRIIKMLHGFSSVQVFKPTKSHAIRSSFYLVAKNVQSDSSACLRAMNLFKTVWEYATFENTSQETFRLCTELTLKEQSLSTELEEFGPWYTELARPIWRTQADALAVASFTQDHDAIS